MADRSNDWMAAMRQAEHEADLVRESKERKAGGSADGDVLANVTSAAGRVLGALSKAGREQRRELRRERAGETPLERDIRVRNKPRGSSDVPKVAPDDRLKLRAVIGHITLDDTEVWAWYTITGVSHGFSPVSSVERAIRGDAIAYSKLQGRRIKIRSTTRPYSVRQWAKDTYDDAMASGSPVHGFGTEFLGRDQQHMQSSSFSEKWVYLGVRLSTFRRHSNDPFREVQSLRGHIEDLNATFESSSLGAAPASRDDMEWLLRRSVCLGVPMPRIGVTGNYYREDIPSLEAQADWFSEPLDKHLTVKAKAPGTDTEQTMYVTVLTLGRLSDQSIPQENQTGWMQRTDRLGFPVEWSATIDITPEARTQGWIRGRMDLIQDQMKHYTVEHGMPAPASLKRQMAIATDTQAELDSDHNGTAIRTSGWYRVAVSAPTVEQLHQRVAKLRKVYGSRAELVENPNQYQTAREFIPGEKLSTGAYRRRMSVVTLAAAIPQGTAEIGDRCGVTLGYTAGSAMRAVAWHPHWDMERRDRSGLMVIAGELGSGKTYAGAGLMYRSVMSGVEWNVLDPSDRLGRLCDLPELRDRAQYINLMRGRDGELGPYRVVAEPLREHFETDAEWHLAVADAAGNRTSLMSDVLYSFLKKSMRDAPETDSVINRALSEVPPVRTSSAADVLEALERIAAGKIHTDLETAHRIRARDLLITYQRLAGTPIGRLIFPPTDAALLNEPDEPEKKDIVLRVYTLNGMSIPDAKQIAAGEITETARMSIAVMTLAAWLVQSSIYKTDPKKRKGLLIDEGKQISSIEAGKALITKTATDTRKHNLRAVIMSQNVTHFDIDSDSEDSLGNLVGAALIGHTEDQNAQRAALKVLRAPVGQGYEVILGTLRSKEERRDEIKRDLDGNMQLKPQKTAEQSAAEKRHFIFYDGKNIERMVFDLDAHPHVSAALNSRPRADTSITDQTNSMLVGAQ